ncbi:MAG TPA: hypothetical protein VJJ98_03450 [Sedimentisphaerales bacterium]|nr:hypothetical protein [Sedimentisphaerales bacterium]
METIEKITIRCFFVGMAGLAIWFLFFALADDWVFAVHSTWFKISKEQFEAIHYAGLMFAKAVIFLFFLAPYIACKMCRKKSQTQIKSSRL